VEPGSNKGLGNLLKYEINRSLFIGFINAINRAGYWVSVTSTERSFTEQAILYRQNKKNAEPGHSKHEHNEAIDINITDKKTGKSYSKSTPEAEWRATGIPAIANSLGLQWGGSTNDGKFGTYIDRVHFQVVGGASANVGTNSNDEFIYTQVPVKEMGIDTALVFSNFKVNKFVFNFFLKKLQMDSKYRNVVRTNNNTKLLLEFPGK